MESFVNENCSATLLAILLALNNLEAPLSPTEQAALKKAGQRLAMRPKNWESIIKQLMDGLVANTSFTQLYQSAKSQLDAVNGQILSNQLPTKNELKQALPGCSEVVKRAYFEGQPDDKSNEILNMTINILTTPEPTETTKKLTRLEELWQFLNQPIVKND